MKQVRFVDKRPNSTLFYNTLKQRVDEYFVKNNISKYANTKMVIKTIILLSFYIIPYTSMLIFNPGFGISLLLWSIMGIALAGIGMSVMHDANHNAYSSNPKVNYWIGNSLNLLGGSVFNWKLQHNVLHHTYTNIAKMDDDIDDKLFMRFSPHSSVKWYHKFQYVYVFLFYSILTLYWALLKDFIQFFNYQKREVNRQGKKENTIVLIKIIFVKLFYFFVFIVLPLVLLKMNALQFLTGFFLMHFLAGVILSVVFQLAHTVEQTTHPLPDLEGKIENNWAIHQLNTTVNFARKSKWISWYVGGLNFQVEHHLFTNICHVHYPAISNIVKSTAEEFGVPYLENPTFGEAFRSHMRLLMKLGRTASINHVIG